MPKNEADDLFLNYLIAFSIPFTSSLSTAGLMRMPSHFTALAAILDLLTHLASTSCWYRSNGRQDEFRVSLAALI